MINRIRILLNHINLNAAQFADKIGVQRSSISHVLSGRNKPSLEFIQKMITAFPEINTDWLISGKGNINKESDENIDLFKDEKEKVDISGHSISKMRPETLEKPSLSDEKEYKPSISTTDSRIERVIVFYKDGKFKEYVPE
jgi:transcriptional regulator with XRE-family HTH domain